MLVGFITYIAVGYPFVSVIIGRGECVVFSGLGYDIKRFFPMMRDGEAYFGAGV